MLGLQALYIAIETGGLLHRLFTFTAFKRSSLFSVALSLVLLRPFVKWNTVLQQLGLSSWIAPSDYLLCLRNFTQNIL